MSNLQRLEDKKKYLIFAIFLAAVFLVELVRTAWISDDAAITLRTVLNFMHGYGPTFNIDERVQAYTHPLWFLLISALSGVTRNVFYSTFVLSIGVSLLALWVLMTRVARTPLNSILAAAALILSKAYLDYSTSGLENPLSHLLLITAVLLAANAIEHKTFHSLISYFISCSLLYLTRPDLLVLVLPVTTLVVFENRCFKALLLKAMLIGAIPAIAWTLFSIYYYGFPLPNTAYAKLGTGIPFYERVIQGWKYLLDSASRDPLTLAFIGAGTIIGLRSSRFGIALAAGIMFCLAYVVSIGGDFMSGRFLTTPLLLAAILVARSEISRSQYLLVAAIVAISAFTNIGNTLLSNAKYSNTTISGSGIGDERGYWYQRFGLLTADKNTFATLDWKARDRSVIVLCGGLGFVSISQGPNTHFIDDCALADPLLARLPAKHNKDWRIGHFVRQLPTDYQESVEKNANLLTDLRTRNFYHSIRSITRDPLNDISRLKEILRMNLGLVHQPDWIMYQRQPVPRSSKAKIVELDVLQQFVTSGSWNAAGNIVFKSSVEVVLPAATRIELIDFSIANNGSYKVEFLFNGDFQPIIETSPIFSKAGMVRHIGTLDVPTPLTDRMRITAISGDGLYSRGHFRVNSPKW